MAFWVAIVLSTLAVCLSLAGAENYNTKTHICCNGTVDVKGGNTNCCGTKSYDTTNFTCCGNQIFPLAENPNDPPRYGCCYEAPGSAKPFDVRTQECCSGNILQKPVKDQFYGCCNGKLYNYTSQVCCGEEVLERKAGDECCGSKTYNNSKQLCCEKWGVADNVWAPEYSDIIDRKSNTSICCGRAVADLSKEVCCNDKILPKLDSIVPLAAACCGEQVIDFNNQMCCQTFKNVSGIFKEENSKVHNKTGPGSSCCGVNSFDYFKEVCCNETILPKPEGMSNETWGTCCGDQVMTSYEFQLCDNGRLVERNSTDIWSCGTEGKFYNLTTQNCCFNEILDRDGERDCCFLASKSYDKKTESCCREEVITLTKEDISGEKLACCTPATSFVEAIA